MSSDNSYRRFYNDYDSFDYEMFDPKDELEDNSVHNEISFNLEMTEILKDYNNYNHYQCLNAYYFLILKLLTKMK